MKKNTISILLTLMSFVFWGQNVQQRLDSGETPYDIYATNISLDSLYGKQYQGGIIAYLDVNEGSGLIVSPRDLYKVTTYVRTFNEETQEYNPPTGSSYVIMGDGAGVPQEEANALKAYEATVPWTVNGNESLLNASGSVVGTGNENTTAILEGLGTKGDFAANWCRELKLGGYTDWSLPSVDEFSKVYKNWMEKSSGGNYSLTMYWTSTEVSSTEAEASRELYGDNGSATEYVAKVPKTNEYAVVAVRSFGFSPTIQEQLNGGITPFQIYLKNPNRLALLYGKKYQGGLIAYLNTTDGSGMVIASSDQKPAYWGCGRPPQQYNKYGATGTAIGTGATNTRQIARICGGGAQYVCYYDMGIKEYGYDDWFLPSIDELRAIYLNVFRRGLGDFASGTTYWSSTNVLCGDPKYYRNPPVIPVPGITFDNLGGRIDAPRSTNQGVRPARYFSKASVAEVSTELEVTNLNAHGADCMGMLVNNGGALTKETGICYGLSPNPTVDDGVIVANVTMDSLDRRFTAVVKGLKPGTKYYARAFAKNTIGLSYGNLITFTTEAVLPEVKILEVMYLGKFSLVADAEIVSNGGGTVSDKGFVIGTEDYPEIGKGTQLNEGVAVGDSKYRGVFSGLTADKEYNLRAYVENEEGISYSEPWGVTVSHEKGKVKITKLKAIGAGVVTVEGELVDNGQDKATTVSLSYGTTIKLGAKQSVSLGEDSSFTVTIEGLSPSQKYYIQAVATNKAGTFNTQMYDVTTQSAPVIESVVKMGVITRQSAKIGVTIESKGGSSITEKGICYGTTENPTVSDAVLTASATLETTILSLKDLEANTEYYIVPYAKNGDVVTYGKQISFTTSKFVIGEEYLGGVVYFLESNGKHGIIVAKEDLSTLANWGCVSTFVSGARFALFGGKANTTAILQAGCTSSDSAAGLAAVYSAVPDRSDKGEWFLPSIGELKYLFNQRQMASQLKLDTDSNTGVYWSSTQYSDKEGEQVNKAYAYVLHMGVGEKFKIHKGSSNKVRPVRYF